MKVFLLKDVPKVGQRGTIVDVADGYGRNYLIRNGYARVADAGAIAEAEARSARQLRKQSEKAEAVSTLRTAISEAHLHFKKKANERGHLFAAVSAHEILTELERLGFSGGDPKALDGVPIKETGEHTIHIRVGGAAVPLRVTISAI